MIHIEYTPETLRPPRLSSWRVGCKVAGLGQHMVNGGNDLPVRLFTGESARARVGAGSKRGTIKKRFA